MTSVYTWGTNPLLLNLTKYPIQHINGPFHRERQSSANQPTNHELGSFFEFFHNNGYRESWFIVFYFIKIISGCHIAMLFDKIKNYYLFLTF